MSLQVSNSEQSGESSWMDQPVLRKSTIRFETILFIGLVLIAIFTRFYILGARVMSHDENTHVYYSWRLFKGEGFSHDPLMHGPLQFHMIALSYFMFGDNDFSARIPAALCGILMIAFMWKYRGYLGRSGAMVATILLLISPYLFYYARYARNEAYVALFCVISIWAILRYLETGEAKYTYWVTASFVLHYTSKETAFIFTAQVLLFLVLYMIYQVVRRPWQQKEFLNFFLITFVLGVVLIGLTGSLWLLDREQVATNASETASPIAPGDVLSSLPSSGPGALVITLGILGVIAFLASLFFLFQGYSWKELRANRSFGLLILLGTFVLPQLSAFPVRLMGWDIPTNAGEVNALNITNIYQIAIFLVPLSLISIIIGLIWNRKIWLVNAGIWYGIFTIFYTTVFTNGAGFFTGIVGSLGYWLEQQGVQRGSQPWYYYWLVQIPVYEYLAALGSLLALSLVIFRKRLGVDVQGIDGEQNHAPVVPLLGFLSITGVIAYSIAGEKMPWLTVHITLPMILLSGWALGVIIDRVDWSRFKNSRGWLTILFLAVFIVTFFISVGSLLGSTPPFQGKELTQLRATSTFIFSLLMFIISGVGLYTLLKTWPWGQLVKVILLSLFTLMGILTLRTSISANYQNYDNANELLVYAHSARGVKDALTQIEEISRRTTDGLAIQVAYDNETSYPYYWYFRNYPNARFYGKDPSRSLRDSAAILVGEPNYAKIEPVVGEAYYKQDYIRLWWPNQDYYGLSLKRIWDAVKNPEMREALFRIWLDRDYSRYGEVLGRDMSLPNWSPAVKMRLYIRKDIASSLWNYGIAPTEEQVIADPYEGKGVDLSADRVIGSFGSEPGQLNRPRDLALAEDGSIYVADTENHRIQHFKQDGTLIHQWGSFGDITAGEAPGGTFNQPWGLALGQDGSVYVADLWNHRIQKFTPGGEFIKMWGYFGQAESPEAFWGPRDVAVDSNDQVFVVDTGNKRVVIFDQDGNFISQFGSLGMALGQFDEPVGITIDEADRVYIADTWNQRIQKFEKDAAGEYQPVQEWEVYAWFGESLDNKPYLDIDPQGFLYVTDPEGLRVLEFKDDGTFIRYWGDLGAGLNQFALVGSVAVDPSGGVWVTDTGNNRIMHFPVTNP